MSILERLYASISEYGDKIAIVATDRSLSYSEMESEIKNAQAWIRSAGTPKNRRIGVLTGDTSQVYVNILAILLSGNTYIPLNAKNPPERNQAIVDDAEIDVVLAHQTHDSLSLVAANVIDTSAPASALTDTDYLAVSAADLAYIFFTSGSTGRPKGVPISYRALDAFMDVLMEPIQGESRGYNFSAEDRFLQMFDLTFDLSVMSFLLPLSIGAAVHVVPESGVVALNMSRILREDKITVALMVPSALVALSRYFDEISLPDMRYSLFCGEALPQTLVQGWSKCVPNAAIQNVYGPTEATIFCLRFDYQTPLRDEDVYHGVVSIGQPYPGVGALVMDHSNLPVAKGEVGELILFGDQLTNGYLNNAEKNAEAFFPFEGKTGYRSGDLCYVNEHDNLLYVGRTDHQVKIDGYRIELGEIENQARLGAQRGLCAAIVAPDKFGNQSIHLFVEDNAEPSEIIEAQISATLPVYMRPKKIIRLDSLPLNSNGKIDRPTLRQSLG